MNRVLNITKRGATATIWNGLTNTMIDGTDFPTDKEWQKAILEEAAFQISNWSIENVPNE